MITQYQKIVTKEVFEKRFSELDCKQRAQVNTFIEKFGYMKIYKYPELIKDTFPTMINTKNNSMSGWSILDDYDIIEIRSALKRGARGVDLAEKYKVTPQAISHIKNNIRRKNVRV